jgi:glycosyltransferase involved in cell wall biosynthesis
MNKLRILFIPVSHHNPDSNEHIPSRLRLLSGENDILGLELKGSPYVGMESPRGLVVSLIYSLKVFFYAMRHKRDFDLVFAWEPFYSLLGLLIARLSDKPCVRDSGIVTRFHFQQMKTFKSRITTIFAWMAEKTIFRSMDLMIVLSEFDRKSYLKSGYQPSRVVVVPLSVEFSLSDRSATTVDVLRKQLGFTREQKLLIFTGGRDYLPNRRAVHWINTTLARSLSSGHGDTRIIFTGAGRIPVLVHPAAVFTGFVPNYFEYLRCADILIAPLRPQSGVLVKILDAMSCSKPVVVMKEAVKGLPQMIDGENAMIAGSDVEFIEKTRYLLDHPDYARRMGLKARQMVEEHYSPVNLSKELNQVLSRCLRKKNGIS